jgi:hypothetical protein
METEGANSVTEVSDVMTEKLELKVKEYASIKIKTENNKIIPIFLFLVFLLGVFFLPKVLNEIQIRDN